MMRTPIYSTKAQPVINDGSPTAPEGVEQQVRSAQRDDYVTKLVKYVPGEVVAGFGGLIALAGNVNTDAETKRLLVITMFFIFLVLVTPFYFALRCRSLEQENKPKWFFYLLSALAFGVWALAVSDTVRSALNMGPTWAEFMLGVGSFVIPGIDEGLTLLSANKPWGRWFGRGSNSTI
jgi:hypothetical protein